MISDKERFLQMCSFIRRDGIDDLLDWLENTSFYSSDLLSHSLKVCDRMVWLIVSDRENMDNDGTADWTREEIALICLFHDINRVKEATFDSCALCLSAFINLTSDEINAFHMIHEDEGHISDDVLANYACAAHYLASTVDKNKAAYYDGLDLSEGSREEYLNDDDNICGIIIDDE